MLTGITLKTQKSDRFAKDTGSPSDGNVPIGKAGERGQSPLQLQKLNISPMAIHGKK